MTIETDIDEIQTFRGRHDRMVDLAIELLRRAAMERPHPAGRFQPDDIANRITATSPSMLNVIEPGTRSMEGPEPAAALLSAFGVAALGARVDASALTALGVVDPDALSAAASALADTPLSISSISGESDPEDGEWHYLVIEIEAGTPGSPMWLQALENAGRALEAAAERHPELAEAIATQILIKV